MHNKESGSELIAGYYERYEQKIYRLAYAITGDRWQAEEAVQETFIRVIRHRDMVGNMPDSRRWTYISKIARSISIDMYRKNKKNPETFKTIIEDSDSADMLENMVWNQSNISEQEDMTEQIANRELVNSILDRLNDEDALVLKLRVVRQLSVRETAAVMQMTDSAVRKKYERAVKKAHKLLVKEMMLDGE